MTDPDPLAGLPGQHREPVRVALTVASACPACGTPVAFTVPLTATTSTGTPAAEPLDEIDRLIVEAIKLYGSEEGAGAWNVHDRVRQSLLATDPEVSISKAEVDARLLSLRQRGRLYRNEPVPGTVLWVVA